MKSDKIYFMIAQNCQLGEAKRVNTGDILAALRREKGIGQKELASHLNLSVGTISNYENNIHSPDLVTLSRLADYYDVTTDYLLNRTDFRSSLRTLNRRVTKEYTVLDIVNTILSCDTSAIGSIMEYAAFLQSKRPRQSIKPSDRNRPGSPNNT